MLTYASAEAVAQVSPYCKRYDTYGVS
jgi:hypothetical protein